MSHADSDPTPCAGKPASQSWDDWIEEKIRKAQDAGLFDHLSGEGKPLPSRHNPFAPSGHELAYDLLRTSGHTLPWIDEGREIDRRVQAVRHKLRQHADWYRQRVQGAEDREAVDAVWAQHLAEFRQEIAAINELIDCYNLKVPSLQFQKLRLLAEEEITRVQDE